MKERVGKILRKLPLGRKILQARALLRADRKNPQLVLPGHFYSPIPDFKEILRDENRIFSKTRRQIPGIDLNQEEQWSLLKELRPYYQELPFGDRQQAGLRYYFINDQYSYSDAIFLYCLIRHFRPKKTIEIGSGFSSCLILDTNEIHFQGSIDCTFIEPYPDHFFSLLKAEEISPINLLRTRLQDIDIDLFRSLAAGDMLIIDSTHVAKAGSDVNHIFFEILPALAGGVLIHFHDIFYPFEYDKEWILGGRSWNEAYLLKAFLQFNDSFKIILFTRFLDKFYEEYFVQEMPLCQKDRGGSIWIKRK